MPRFIAAHLSLPNFIWKEELCCPGFILDHLSKNKNPNIFTTFFRIGKKRKLFIDEQQDKGNDADQ